MLPGCLVCLLALLCTTTGWISIKLDGSLGKEPKKNPLNVDVDLDKGMKEFCLVQIYFKLLIPCSVNVLNNQTLLWNGWVGGLCVLMVLN